MLYVTIETISVSEENPKQYRSQILVTLRTSSDQSTRIISEKHSRSDAHLHSGYVYDSSRATLHHIGSRTALQMSLRNLGACCGDQ